MHAEPQFEHQWLQKLVGEWTCTSECGAGPDQPPIKTEGTETVRTLGGIWTVGEGIAGNAETELHSSIMTLGYDPKIQRFVGSFVADMMTHLWPYNGVLDADRKVLTLDSEGPSFFDDGTMAKYQDIIEFIDDNHRTLSSRVLMPDGTWKHFMMAHYYRKPSGSK